MKLAKLFLLLASASALVVSSDGSAFAGSATKPLYVGATVAATAPSRPVPSRSAPTTRSA